MGENTTVLGQKDSGKTVQLRVGQSLFVELEDIGTTGYRWEFALSDPTVLEIASNKLSPHPGIGAGGLRQVTLRAQKPGHCLFSAQLRRPWEKEKAAQQQFQITAEVGP